MNLGRARITLIFCFFLTVLQAQKLDFKNYSIADGLPQSDVFDAVQDHIGYIWFATQGGGIARFDGDRFTTFNQKNGLISNFANALFYRNDSLFIGTNNGLSIKIKNRFVNYKTPKINKIRFIKNKLLLATDEGIYLLKQDYVLPIKINLKIDLSAILEIQFDSNYYWLLSNNNAWKLNELNEKATIKSVSEKSFSTKFDKLTKRFEQLKINPTLKVATKNIFIDNQQNTWLLTKGNGVYKSVVSNFIHYTDIGKISVKSVSAIHKNNHTIWFTDTNKNLFMIDDFGLNFLQKNNFNTTSIASDINSNLWFGSENNGIFIYRRKSAEENNFTIEKLNSQNGFPYNSIRNIHIQKDTVWVVTQQNGIAKLTYDFNNNFVKKIERLNQSNGFKNEKITTSLLYNHRIWFGTENGNIGFIDKNSISYLPKKFSRNTTISTIKIHKKSLYIGTLGKGLWSFNIDDYNNIKQLDNSFLSSKNIHQLLSDNDNLWIGSEKGLDKLEIRNNSVVNTKFYNVNDGFLGIETSKNTALKDANGFLWFGTKNGITKFIPTNTKKANQKPIIYFDDIEISYQNIDSITTKFKKDVLQLNPKQNNISFSFKTVDINQPKRIEYQWKLNDNVSPWTTNTSINFANLDAGYYQFSVTSKNASKLESKPKNFSFFIDKPLHKKTWFIILISGVFILISFITIYLYFKRLKATNKARIEKLTLENHLITLEQKALQLQMNPHFIFNVLNGIKALGNKGNTQELNATISKFSSLLRALLQASKKEEISLSEEIKSLTNYLDLEYQMKANFSYEINTKTNDIAVDEILIPPMLVQPFVENSIKHGFKNLNKKGEIKILFQVDKEILSCCITDNGVGFKHSQQTKKSENHNSIALKVTEERIKNLSEKSTFKILEIKENSTILGTKVEFTIPLKTDF